jgi:hypothetical protein
MNVLQKKKNKQQRSKRDGGDIPTLWDKEAMENNSNWRTLKGL